MVQNLRAYFILYVITIRCRKCMHEKFEFLAYTKTKADLNQSFRRSLPGYNDQATIRKLLENSQGWQKNGILLPRGQLPWLRSCSFDAFRCCRLSFSYVILNFRLYSHIV